MKKTQISRFMVFFVLAATVLVTACNFALLIRPHNSSFDEAHLMMIASRGLLDLYVPPEGSALIRSQNVPAGYVKSNSEFSSLDKLNQHKALQAYYQRLLDAAIKDGNQPLIDAFKQKVQYQKSEADHLEAERANWRRSRRFFTVVNRGFRGFGQFIGQVIDFVGQNTAGYIKCQVESYVEQIQAFLKNPVRYVFDLTINQKLTIIRNQFLDRLGPFFGQRAYDLLKLDQAVWKEERRIFDRSNTKASKTARLTMTPTTSNNPDQTAETDGLKRFLETDCNVSGVVFSNINVGYYVDDIFDGNSLICDTSTTGAHGLSEVAYFRIVAYKPDKLNEPYLEIQSSIKGFVDQANEWNALPDLPADIRDEITYIREDNDGYIFLISSLANVQNCINGMGYGVEKINGKYLVQLSFNSCEGDAGAYLATMQNLQNAALSAIQRVEAGGSP